MICFHRAFISVLPLPLVMPNVASKNLFQESGLAIVFWLPQNQVLIKIS